MRLILDFPHGATPGEADEIAGFAQKIVKAGVSEGGFATTNKYGMNVENVTFSPDTMNYVFGHDRSKKVKSDD